MRLPDLLTASSLSSTWQQAAERHRSAWSGVGIAAPAAAREAFPVSRETELAQRPFLPFPLQALDAPVHQDLFEALERYAYAVLEANRDLALVSRRDPARQILVNILDSLPLGFLLSWSARIGAKSGQDRAMALGSSAGVQGQEESASGLSWFLDAGSGSGCPGIPAFLAMTLGSFPQDAVPPTLVLLESVGKKSDFLAGLVEKMSLAPALVLRQRLEDPSLPGLLDEYELGEMGLLTSRGLAKISRILKWCRNLRPFLNEAILIKGVDGLTEEWRDDRRQWSRWGWTTQALLRFDFPDRSQILVKFKPE